MKVKVLTLTQPWASLMWLQEKRNETRGWGTAYRGPLAIHAAQGFKPEDRAIFYEDPFFITFQHHGINKFEELPRGVILCVLNLKHIDKVDTDYKLPAFPERAFGGYGLGRKIWTFGPEIQRFDPPIPAKGKQSLWEFDLPSFQIFEESSSCL